MIAPTRIADELWALGVCTRAGLLGVEPPHRVIGAGRALHRWGALGGGLAIAARKHGDRTAIVDERGSLSFAELDRCANALANAWRSSGLQAGDGVAILARNHRGFLEATFAGARLGARLIYLNTDFAGPQIAEVAGREGARMLVADEEYADAVALVDAPLGCFRAWAESPGDDTIDALIDGSDPAPPPKPERGASVVILTSGTTGTPKGAPRDEPRSLVPLGALLSKAPFRAREVTLLGAPMFHALGFAQALLAVAMGSTLVLRRRFEPAAALDDLERHSATAIVVVPVMLARLLDAIEERGREPDLPALRVVFVAGSQLGGVLATRALEALGDVVYNLYGSTEVSYATIATPEDLRAEPDCVGRTPRGAIVRIVDDAGKKLPTGQTGRVFVGNAMAFEGYTGGETKEVLEGLMSTGDVGHLDEGGRLFIDGRDDDMIVSGGENVFPGEVEELLNAHAAVSEAAVIGVPDDRFGQRLRAFVVVRADSEPTGDELREYVRENLARYKVPREVVFLDELPRNPTGKVLKKHLRDHATG